MSKPSPNPIDSDSEDSAYYYQTNLYYGIFYSAELIDTVREILKNSQFAELALEESTAVIKGVKLFSTMNADDDDYNLAFIAVDDSFNPGAEFDDPSNTWIDIDPKKIQQFYKNSDALEVTTSIYDTLIEAFKVKDIPLDSVYQGWRAVSCKWDAQNTEEN